MRIGIDASLAALKGTGTGRYAALLVEHLLALDRDDDFVLYFRGSDREANPLFGVRGPRIAARVTDAPLTLMRIHLNLPWRLARDGIELYHSLGFFLPWLWRGAMVVSIHDIHPVIQPQYWGGAGTRADTLALRAHIPAALRQARRILALSEYVKQTLCDAYRVPADKVVVAPPGLDPFFAAPPGPEAVEAAARAAGGDRFVLYVGALAPHKNVDGLVRAFARLPAGTAAGLRLVLVGTPLGHHLDRTLRPLIRALGLEARVTLTGYVPDERLRALYHAAAALVLPSFGEGFGLPVIEAMACGTPVVTARGSALPETAGDAALYVDPCAPDDLAETLARLLEDAALARDLAGRGRARAATFTWERTAGQVLRAYREAAAR